MTDIETFRKKLLYRASYRGFKEADIVLSSYANDRIASMNETELNEFAALLKVPDHDLYDWIIGAVDTPPQFDGPVMRELQARIPKG